MHILSIQTNNKKLFLISLYLRVFQVESDDKLLEDWDEFEQFGQEKPLDMKTIPLKVGDKIALQGLNEKFLTLNCAKEDVNIELPTF